MPKYKRFTVERVALDIFNSDFLELKRNDASITNFIAQTLPELSHLESAIKANKVAPSDRKPHALAFLKAMKRLFPIIEQQNIDAVIDCVQKDQYEKAKNKLQGIQSNLSVTDSLAMNMAGCIDDLLVEPLNLARLKSIMNNVKEEILQKSGLNFFVPLLLTQPFLYSAELSALAKAIELNSLKEPEIYAEMFIKLIDKMGLIFDISPPLNLNALFQEKNYSAIHERLNHLPIEDRLARDYIAIAKILLQQEEGQKSLISEKIRAKLQAMQKELEIQLGRDLISEGALKAVNQVSVEGSTQEFALDTSAQPALSLGVNGATSDDHLRRFYALRSYLQKTFELNEATATNIARYMTCWSQSSFTGIATNLLNQIGHNPANANKYIKSENLGISLLIKPSHAWNQGEKGARFAISGVQCKLKIFEIDEQGKEVKELGILTVTGRIRNDEKMGELWKSNSEFYLGQFDSTEYTLSYQASCEEGAIYLPDTLIVESDAEVIGEQASKTLSPNIKYMVERASLNVSAQGINDKDQIIEAYHKEVSSHPSTWLKWALLGTLLALIVSPIVVPMVLTVASALVATYGTGLIAGAVLGGLLLIGFAIGFGISYIVDRVSNSQAIIPADRAPPYKLAGQGDVTLPKPEELQTYRELWHLYKSLYQEFDFILSDYGKVLTLAQLHQLLFEMLEQLTIDQAYKAWLKLNNSDNSLDKAAANNLVKFCSENEIKFRKKDSIETNGQVFLAKIKDCQESKNIYKSPVDMFAREELSKGPPLSDYTNKLTTDDDVIHKGSPPDTSVKNQA